MHVALIDYGVGNLHSLAKAIEAGGARVRIEADPSAAVHAAAIVLPGVGAFGAAAERLAPARDVLRTAIAAGVPCLGVCLGMQLLFDSSAEGTGAGLGILTGRVRKLRTRRLPHMGWNDVHTSGDSLFDGVPNLLAYYANSFVVDARDESAVIAWTECDSERFPAAVRTRNVTGVQFHPEKSGPAGLRVIANFLRSAR